MSAVEPPAFACVNDCHFVDVPEFVDARGNLLFAQNDGHLPFVFQRMYAIYQVPTDAERAARNDALYARLQRRHEEHQRRQREATALRE